ncbi:GH39 family glycosyl hydrolase [Puniceicoccus vermicola]|uniref:Glycosyl hydrolases family 39 N-terminal catalytic domain-containing protein n=1 Tax=Puniceicoccus vermicola TaxID=388746 RepID=A0A7X1B0M0_9BACT|nr:hypothetical protein [Puniceicoccus vermicola]MBC2603431.1 hypothetical protein [Puniceicoccus vermicola]
MKQNSIRRNFVLLLFTFSACCASTGQDLSSVEPEGTPTGFTRVLLDTDASSGQYIAATADGTTLTQIPINRDEPFEVWVRYRGLPLVLNDSAGMQLSRIAANESGEWQWASMGEYQSGDNQDFLEVFSPFSDRGASEKPSGLDLVVVADVGTKLSSLESSIQPADKESLTVPDADVVLQSETALPSQSDSIDVEVSIDWSEPTGQVADRQYSLNIFNGYDSSVAQNPQYIENIAYMAAPVLRYHNMSGMLADPSKNRFSWMDTASRTWSAERIAAALDPLEGLSEERVITIGKWPSWMDLDKDGMLDADQYEAFAQLCADLVRILNIEQQRGIQYFEISNERDMVYWLRQMKKGQPLQIDELAEIYNLCVQAMKAVDPSIKIGGPAACRGDLVQPLKQFAILTMENLDFLSYHAYASGDATETDINIYNRAGSLGKNLSTIRSMLNDISPDRRIELHLNEYNICYTHRVRDERMATHKGGVFDALVFVELVENGADVGNAWNECDGVYGKMGRDYTLRPPAHVFHFFNTGMTGPAVKSTSDHPDVIVPFAVLHEDGNHWVLINRSSYANNARIELKGREFDDQNVRIFCLSETGLKEMTHSLSELARGIDLPPDSVAFFFLPDDSNTEAQ